MKLLLIALSVLATAAAASDADLPRCRAITDTAQRLACYDALAVAPAPLAAPAAVSAAAAPIPTPAAAASFGLEQQRDAVQEISSHIPGAFDGWGPKTRFRLANGQLWQVSDDSRATYDLRDPKATVRRATLGGFVLDIEGARRAPRVRRIE